VIVLGISGVLGHDAAACLLRDGELIAFAEEERFTRQKHAPVSFPIHATLACLAMAGIGPGEVETIAASWDPALDPTSGYLATWLPQFLRHPLWQGHQPRQVYIGHHLAHAAAAAYFSGVTDAAVLVVDGNGEQVSTTIARLDDTGYRVFEEYPVADSLGHFYTRAAFYLGLGQHAEGKLMGLAGYGDPVHVIEPIELGAERYAVTFDRPDHLPTLERLRRLAGQWDAWLANRFGPPLRPQWAWNRDLWLGKPTLNGVLGRRDVAASVQRALSDAVVMLARRATSLAGNRKLILAGGVALNGGANEAVLAAGAADELCFFPACNDSGGALGAAAWAARDAGDRWRRPENGPYLGPEPAPSAVEALLARSGLVYRRAEDVSVEAARRTSENRVIGWYRGRMEAGPRALGHRSILARADDRGVAARVNRIKLREDWRPFGPALREADAACFFERGTPAPYMLEFRTVRESARASLSGVTHVDGTTRPQTVTAASNGPYERLIGVVGELTGVPAIINTSFNIGPEPIVCSPLDAIRAFVSSDLDDLFIEDFVVSKGR
jgi:carbamoyltransferase